MGVVETDSGFQVLDVNTLQDNVGAEGSRLYHKPEPSPALEAALKTRAATIFSDFARFPWAKVEEAEDGFTVTLRDLRFDRPAWRGRGFVTEIGLDKDLRVRSESFNFSIPPTARR
jgi:hypothetical protein